MSEVPLGPSRLIFNYRSVTPESYTLVPRLRVDFDVHYALAPGQPGYTMVLNFGNSELRIITKTGENLYAGMLISAPPLTLPPNSSSSCSLFVDLDHYRLAQIEKVREGKDLQARVDMSFIAELQQQPQPSILEEPLLI